MNAYTHSLTRLAPLERGFRKRSTFKRQNHVCPSSFTKRLYDYRFFSHFGLVFTWHWQWFESVIPERFSHIFVAIFETGFVINQNLTEHFFFDNNANIDLFRDIHQLLENGVWIHTYDMGAKIHQIQSINSL